LGLYSKYLVRYVDPKGTFDYKIADTLILDYPIMALSEGDIFGIGINYLVVVTSGSLSVVGPKAIDKFLI